MDFGDAMKAVISGKKARRRGWITRYIAKVGNPDRIVISERLPGFEKHTNFHPSQSDMFADDWIIE